MIRAILLCTMLSACGACQTEDSDFCVWNAQTMGNGQGRSFIAVFGQILEFRP